MNIDSCHGSRFNVLGVEESGVKDYDRSEIFVPTAGVEEPAFLDIPTSTISFSAMEKSGGR